MEAILHDKVQIAEAVYVTVIQFDDTPKGYEEFDRGAARKYVLDPHGVLHA
jgi:glutathione-independent formaldehyde dehydrogenase